MPALPLLLALAACLCCPVQADYEDQMLQFQSQKLPAKLSHAKQLVSVAETSLPAQKTSQLNNTPPKKKVIIVKVKKEPRKEVKKEPRKEVKKEPRKEVYRERRGKKRPGVFSPTAVYNIHQHFGGSVLRGVRVSGPHSPPHTHTEKRHSLEVDAEVILQSEAPGFKTDLDSQSANLESRLDASEDTPDYDNGRRNSQSDGEDNKEDEGRRPDSDDATYDLDDLDSFDLGSFIHVPVANRSIKAHVIKQQYHRFRAQLPSGDSSPVEDDEGVDDEDDRDFAKSLFGATNFFGLEAGKQQRSAGEVSGGPQSGKLSQAIAAFFKEAGEPGVPLDIARASSDQSPEQAEPNSIGLLHQRLLSSGGQFDPSILVDFSSLSPSGHRRGGVQRGSASGVLTPGGSLRGPFSGRIQQRKSLGSHLLASQLSPAPNGDITSAILKNIQDLSSKPDAKNADDIVSEDILPLNIVNINNLLEGTKSVSKGPSDTSSPLSIKTESTIGEQLRNALISENMTQSQGNAHVLQTNTVPHQDFPTAVFVKEISQKILPNPDFLLTQNTSAKPPVRKLEQTTRREESPTEGSNTFTELTSTKNEKNVAEQAINIKNRRNNEIELNAELKPTIPKDVSTTKPEAEVVEGIPQKLKMTNSKLGLNAIRKKLAKKKKPLKTSKSLALSSSPNMLGLDTQDLSGASRGGPNQLFSDIEELLGGGPEGLMASQGARPTNTVPAGTSNAIEANNESSPFGPFSDGNDPSAGVPPPGLPPVLRASLYNYLVPRLMSLAPLTETIPGVPGLDYPIMAVVPYTNFYCSNMPWAGFYADTEARCQSWHWCDLDGRQSTFLCPNGTIFNQAFMVCDWWYNSDCQAAPYLYPLNERVYPQLLLPPPTQQHRTLTAKVLDTLFV